jgi:hypothetical protein
VNETPLVFTDLVCGRDATEDRNVSLKENAMGGKRTSSTSAPVVKTPAKPAPVVEVPLPPTSRAAENGADTKAATIRRVSAKMGGETEPKKIVARLKEQGVPWCQSDKDCEYIVRYAWNLFNRPKGKRQPEMDLDTILVRLEQVRGFAQQHGGKDKLLAMIANAREVEKMAEQVGGLENLSKFATKV